jgi:hypothetical protein
LLLGSGGATPAESAHAGLAGDARGRRRHSLDIAPGAALGSRALELPGGAKARGLLAVRGRLVLRGLGVTGGGTALFAGEPAAGAGPAKGGAFVIAGGPAFAEVISHDQSPRR